MSADNAALAEKSCARMGYRRFGTIYMARPGLLGLRQPASWLDPVFVVATPGCRQLGFRLDRSPVGVEPLPLAVPVPA